jgi:hypothetical protein
MSSLGIRYALPYTGTNGLKVTGNQIGLDAHSVGHIGALQIGDILDTTETNNGDKLTIYGQGLDDSQLVILNNGGEVFAIGEAGNAVSQSGIFAYGDITTQNNINIENGNLLLLNNNSVGSKIQFNSGKANECDLTVLPETTGAVVPATTKYIPVTINGVSYKLIIAN